MSEQYSHIWLYQSCTCEQSQAPEDHQGLDLTPLLLENVKTDASIAVNVRMETFVRKETFTEDTSDDQARKMGGVVGKSESPETKLEAKTVEAMQHRASKGTTIKSFNSIILKFPKIDHTLRKCKAIFEQFDEDSNGAIDHEELKKCLHKLQVCFTEEEIEDLFKACDMNEDMGIKFNEFIVLLCLAYLLKDNATEFEAATFETLVDAFVLLDKNKDGYVSKTEMVQAINESGERSSGPIATKRFGQLSLSIYTYSLKATRKLCQHRLWIAVAVARHPRFIK
ncbi:hypothetical protein Gotri_011882 [Gossypium trilobum]|uniref:EF-hand domain-containing protein n=1 Tax=Gossypium trilobum TaxID=34281 RepID=A0A7J9EV78_9ROSI|nr:hypothetical protein [Gossypium trilobum]